MPFLSYKYLKLKLRVFSVGYTVAIVTCCVVKMIATYSAMIGKIFDTMIVALTHKEWL